LYKQGFVGVEEGVDFELCLVQEKNGTAPLLWAAKDRPEVNCVRPSLRVVRGPRDGQVCRAYRRQGDRAPQGGRDRSLLCRPGKDAIPHGQYTEPASRSILMLRVGLLAGGARGGSAGGSRCGRPCSRLSGSPKGRGTTTTSARSDGSLAGRWPLLHGGAQGSTVAATVSTSSVLSTILCRGVEARPGRGRNKDGVSLHP